MMRERKSAEMAGPEDNNRIAMPGEERRTSSERHSCAISAGHTPSIFSWFTTQDLEASAPAITRRFSALRPMHFTQTAGDFCARAFAMSAVVNPNRNEREFCKTGESLGTGRRFGKPLIRSGMIPPPGFQRFSQPPRIRLNLNQEQLSTGWMFLASDAASAPRNLLAIELQQGQIPAPHAEKGRTRE